MKDYLIYILYKLFRGVVLFLPKGFMKIVLNLLAKLAYLLDKKHRKYAKINLDLVYENKISEERKEEIIKNSYYNLVFNLYEQIENNNLNLEELEKKITLENENIITDALKENKNIILISAHYGNWEYITSYISLKYAPTTMVGRPLNNKYLNDDLRKSRESHNSEMLDKKGSAKGLIKALKNGRIIGLAIDQHVPVNKGEKIKFLGHDAVQTDSSTRIAIKTGALIIPVFFIKDDFRKYTIKFCEAIDPLKYDNDVNKITQLQADAMSNQILEKPDDWFWQHRRWKDIYLGIYSK